MGFKCPNCRVDFGNIEKDLWKHLYESVECSAESELLLAKVEMYKNLQGSKKDRVYKYTVKGNYTSFDRNKT